MKQLLVVLLILTVPFISFAQPIKGKITNDTGAPLQGATVAWINSKKGTVTNEMGEFLIDLPKKSPHSLLISYVGYKTDTIQVTDTSFLEIALRAVSALHNVTVEGRKRASYISANPIKTEVITSLELKKAACCDLSGCFETQASVQPQTTNIITNSKELRILGLSGIYNQVLIDGFPQIQGLTYTYGISSIPGTLVDNIWVAKGANSVLQGFESISGQINVLTKEPDKADKLLLNAYINSFGEKHLNANYSFRKGKWSSLTALHIVQPAGRVDRDDDRFLDLPLLTRYAIANRWKKGDEAKWGWSTQFNVRYLSEKRIGGQTGFNYDRDKGTGNAYGQAVSINQPEAWFKTAFRMNDEHRFALYVSGSHQDQQSYFGVTAYKAKQAAGYANLQYEFGYKNNSVLKTGISYRHLNLSEKILFSNNSLNRTYAGIYNKVENIPGVFAENIINSANDKLTWIAGIRADHHNRFGWEVTPRTLLKYAATPNLTFRGSIGTGWRTANIFSENVGLLVSSRDIIFAEALQPEKALNVGFNATQKFKSKNVEGYVSLDFYRTSFQNQIFPEYDADPTKAIIKNFTGKSVSNGFQAEVSGTFYNRFAAKAGYVYLDVYQMKDEGKDILPFNPNHRLHTSASFMPLNRKWHIDANAHWYGIQKLPDTKNNPVLYQRPGESNPYTVVSTQFTYNIKRFEVYAGVENIFNFRQNKPLIGWQDPFGKYFDTQFAWGPTRGREAYLGIRYTVK
ncbi:TonB-dependent receptor [Paracnuella aquatica]|uniref:TonB-dependent receptor n=1 Tax=Paracnuella aquatica TaxID=2268757 RepID=UPI000DEF7E9B|nr:TonB-dependent receptor [Paracnuella aquatica]RPD44026.1 TonB-dependent receptor [Paracnuella aquatica]